MDLEGQQSAGAVGPPAAHMALRLRASGGLDEEVHVWGCLRKGREGWWGGSLCIRL